MKNPYPITRPLLLGLLLASQACQYDAPRPTSKLASRFDAERQQEPVTRTVYVPATKSQAARQVEIRCYET